MREKIYGILTKTYGILMMVSFFAALIPVIPFIVALCVGGPTAEAICIFLYKEYYVWVIAAASIAVVIGLVAMYIGKKEGLSVKSVGKKDKK
jgi:hypothetical protein